MPPQFFFILSFLISLVPLTNKTLFPKSFKPLAEIKVEKAAPPVLSNIL